MWTFFGGGGLKASQKLHTHSLVFFINFLIIEIAFDKNTREWKH